VLSAGGTVTDAVLLAHSDLAYAWDHAGILSLLRRVNTFSGDQFAAAMVPFINSWGYPIDNSVAFVAGDYTLAGGLVGNGTTKFLKTGVFDPVLSDGDISLMFYGTNYEQTATARCAIGLLEGGTGPEMSLFCRRVLSTTGPSFSSGKFNTTNVAIAFARGYSQGFIAGTAIGTAALRDFWQGNLDNNLPVGSTRTASTTTANRDIFVFARDLNLAIDSPTGCTGYAYGISRGLSDDQMWDYHRALYNLEIALGRETFVNFIATWGDSLTAGTGGTAWPTQIKGLLEVNRGVYNGGVGGETSTQIAARMVADNRRSDNVVVIWSGVNNYGNPDVVRADISAMVDHIQSPKKFLILSILNKSAETIGTQPHDDKIALNNSLAALYPNNYFDIRTYLVGQGNGGAQDNADAANDITPTSLRFDDLHLNTAGYLKVAQQVQAFIAGKGW
jgi:lysophospholipase L1-like esterase